MRACKICGEDISRLHQNTHYCSDECKKRGQKLNRAANKKKKNKSVLESKFLDIIEINKLAREKGLTYGQYVARYGG